DAAGARLLHVRRGRARELEGAAHVGVEDAVPDLHGQLVELGERDADVPGRVVDEHVEPAQLAGRARYGSVDRGGVGLVDLDRARPAAEALDEPRGLHRSVAVADVTDRDVTPDARQRLAGGAAEIAGAASDQRDFRLEVHHARTMSAAKASNASQS